MNLIHDDRKQEAVALILTYFINFVFYGNH
jgi:hypothetical protein